MHWPEQVLSHRLQEFSRSAVRHDHHQDVDGHRRFLVSHHLPADSNETFDTERKLAKLSPPSRVSHTPRLRSSFRKATRRPGIANVGSDRSTNSLTRAVNRSCLGVGTESAANGALDPEHQLRLEIRAVTSSSRLLSCNHARTCLRPCGSGPNLMNQV